ncbi:hypothetical protein RM780_04045 [Streptomyces sp. DSM 44917]|uniref:Minor tail protein n=1 Tax=Streptomyces boetiae TaxID=3075541 RepID=A0ABU2L3J6_9ACTN|nr:hypothetical protein [Streptomyces sp. DSM 44917]MDT0306134.1 hypothetical protein [Streptomyces sp. DSM 44917]
MASDVGLEMQLSTGEWVDLTPRLRTDAPVTIRRGRADRAGQHDPARLTCTINNRDGALSPENPNGPWYGLFGQYTPVRVTKRGPAPYLRVPGTAGRARVLSTSALNIAGDLDVRVELALDRIPAQWGATPPIANAPYSGAIQELIGRHTPAGRMWRLILAQSGRPSLDWSVDGIVFQEVLATDQVAYMSGQRFALRATLDVNDGSGQHVVTFYTAASVAGPWQQLGDPVVRPGTTSINTTGTADLEVGNLNSIGFRPGAGRYYKTEVRNGIDGTVVANPDFTAQAVDATAFTDGAGRSWGVVEGAAITDMYSRFEGDAEAWPASWGRSGQDVYVNLRAWGPLQRLRGTQDLHSTLRRTIPSNTAVLAYWPLEDGADAVTLASGLPGGQPAATYGLNLASESSLPSSAPLPRLGSGTSMVRAPLPSLPDPSLGWRVEMVYRLDALPASNLGWIRVATSGGGIATITGYIGGGQSRIVLRDGEGNTVADATGTNPDALAAAASGWGRVRIVAEPSGGSWAYRVWWTPIGLSENWHVFTTISSFTRPVRFDSVWSSASSGMPIGHITMVNNPDTDVYGAGTGGPDDAYAGETAMIRIRRVAAEERMPISAPGSSISANSERVGPQRIAGKLALVEDAADVDGGVLYESIQALSYRPRVNLYNRQPAMVIAYGQCRHLQPTTQRDIVNDATVSRVGGSSGRAVLEDGPLSVQDPPVGAGPHTRPRTINAYSDARLEQMAAWDVAQGTWPGDRWPTVELYLHRVPAELRQDVLDRLDIQTRVQITDLPPWVAPGPADLIAEGYEEVIRPQAWTMTINASPAGPWTVAEIAGDDPAADIGRWPDTGGSELDADIDTTSTRLLLSPTAGLPWVTSTGPAPTGDADDFPLDLQLGGETVTVASIEPLAWDDFDRLVSNGWGTTPSGVSPTPAWALSGGAASERSAAGGQGIVVVNDTTTPRFQFLPEWSIPDGEVLVAISPQAVATGAALRAGLTLRITGSTYYLLRAVFQTSGAVGIEIAHTTTSLTGVVSTLTTYSAASRVWLRAHMEGQRLRGRVWADGASEPGGWQVDHTFTTSLLTAGPLGVIASRASGNTNAGAIFAFDDFETVTPQYAAVSARSVNGIVKSHLAGTAVRLADVPVIPL